MERNQVACAESTAYRGGTRFDRCPQIGLDYREVTRWLAALTRLLWSHLGTQAGEVLPRRAAWEEPALGFGVSLFQDRSHQGRAL